MVPEPKPNPNNPIPEMPGWSVLAPGFQLPALVLNTAHAAWDLFGSDDDKKGDVQYRGGGGRFGDAPGHEGTAADAEQEAAKKLTERTETLKSLDAQLKSIGDQIIDSNSEKKKRIEAIAGEVQKELQYLDSSKDSSVAKVQAVNEFLSEKSGELAKIITEAADEAAQNRAILAQLQNEYGPDFGYEEGGGGYGGGEGGGGGGGYGGGEGGSGGDGGGGYDNGGYDQGQYEEQQGGGLADTLGQAIPGLASAGQGLASGLTSPMSGLSDLGGIIGSAIKGSGEDRGRADEDNERRDREKADDDRKAEEDRKADEERKAKEEEERKAKEEADRKAKEGQPVVPPAGAQPTGPAPAPPPAPTLVIRPDGSPVTAANSSVAAAAKAVLGGANIEDGYKAAGMSLPALGTPLKDTISPANAGVGDLAVFKDKYEMLLGDKKVYLDGQMQDMAALGKLTGFMGFIKAPASATPNVPAGTPAAGTAAGITPAQLAADPTGAI